MLSRRGLLPLRRRFFDLQDDLDTAKTELTETVQQQLRVLDEQKLKEREAIVGTSATQAQLQRQREALIQREAFPLQQRECELILQTERA